MKKIVLRTLVASSMAIFAHQAFAAEQVDLELLSNVVYETIRQRSDLTLHLPPARRL